jgi:DNA-binding protein H-NS
MESYREYLRKRMQLERDLDQERLQIIEDVIREIQECVALLGITQADIFGKDRRPKRRRKARYFDPVTGKTWSGVGREPLWIKGRDRREFEIG